jgi:hypothetical protein
MVHGLKFLPQKIAILRYANLMDRRFRTSPKSAYYACAKVEQSCWIFTCDLIEHRSNFAKIQKSTDLAFLLSPSGIQSREAERRNLSCCIVLLAANLPYTPKVRLFPAYAFSSLWFPKA